MNPARRLIASAVTTVLTATLALAAAGCGGRPERPVEPVEPVPASETLEWINIGGGVDVAQFVVPRDHQLPEGAAITLYLARHRATKPGERIGSLLVNPGGPGAAGSILGVRADELFSDTLLERFDIIGWDPRGVGRSLPSVDCTATLDPLYANDVTPDDQTETAILAREAAAFAAGCEAGSDGVLPYVSTRQSAGDIDAIRRALGEPKVSYFGFSYGSELGAVWLTMFPGTVRGAVLDGAIDPNENEHAQSRQQAIGFEKALDRLLDACAADKKCAFHADGASQAAFTALLDRIETAPIPTSAGRPPVTSGVALLAVAYALYTERLWPNVYRALADADAGRGDALLDLYDGYLGRRTDGTYDNTIEAFFATGCLDEVPASTTAAEEAELRAAAPRMYPLFLHPAVCDSWPVAADPSPAVSGPASPPVIIIGTTGDPATPLESTRAMADALTRGVLVVVDAEGHTGYQPEGCSGAIVDRYLTDLVPPVAGTTCD